MVDSALQDLWEAPAETALIAVGGYGRGELSPQSDLDLAIVYRGRTKPEKAVKALLYPLWDAGFEVGHGTRTVKDSVRLAGEDLQAHTAFLEARLIAGDAGLYEDFVSSMQAFTRKRGLTFARDLAESTRTRHAAHGDVPFLLEPNLKDGAGGLRDLHVARWLAQFFDDVPSPGAAQEATEILHAVRNLIHDSANRRGDVLLLASQDSIAARLGYPGDRPGDALMRDVYAAARTIWWHTQACVAIATGSPLPECDATPYAAGSWNSKARNAFLATLRSGSVHALEALDQAGVPAAMLPGWENVRSLPQRNVYHRYTVDVHCFEAVAQMVALADDEALSGVWNHVADPDRTLLAALFHDAGKGSGQDHSVRGEQLAREWGGAMGIGEQATDDIAWLVRNHLLLAENATRRDTGDERLVESFAAEVATADRLRMLYALTVADARATGPEALTPWKAALIAELYSKAMHVLERGEVVGVVNEQTIARRVADVRRALTSHQPGEIDSHLLGMTRSYVLTFPAESIVRHFALMNPSPGPEQVRTSLIPAGEPGVYEVVFVARDRPGLMALMSGSLAVNGVNIVAAQAFTRADGIALQTFRVVAAFDDAVDEARRVRIHDTAVACLADSDDLAAQIAERRRTYARESKGKREPTSIVIDNAASDFATIVEVHATDRVGLLYDITKALADLGLDIHMAKIATYGHDVVDAFYVKDLEGQRIHGDDTVAQLRQDLADLIDPNGSG